MKKILAVDDEAPVRDAIALILGKSGCLIDTATSGEEALAMFQAEPYELVLTDMRMPGMSGEELAKHLKSINAGVKVILVTAFPPADASALFDAVILKPFSVRELRNTISAALPAVQANRESGNV